MRFNHMELTFPKGSLDRLTRDEIAAFYGDVFGWTAKDVDVFSSPSLLLNVDPGQFILCHESSKPLSCPGYDHLGLLMDGPDDVDRYLARCEDWAGRDERVEITRYDDLVTPGLTVHAFYVRYLLPIHFDVQSLTPH
jgi:predicted enzyme related to lactoylglutathione lyase